MSINLHISIKNRNFATVYTYTHGKHTNKKDNANQRL